jgi:hypothetical protein
MIPTPYPLEDPLRPIGPVKGVVIRMCACCENVPVWDNDTYCPPCAKNHRAKKVIPQPPLSDVTKKTARKLLKRRPDILKSLGVKDE